MSVEAFTHQLYEPLVIPDNMEAQLRDILSNQLHVHGVDLEIALHNPADMIQRLSTHLMKRYDQPTEANLQVGLHSKTFTVGTGLSDGMQVHQVTGVYDAPIRTELSMATDTMNTLYQEGTVAHITISDDLSWVTVIGYSGRHQGTANYTEVEVKEDYIINEVYMHALNRLLNTIATVEKLPFLSDYVVRELGKSALITKAAA